MVNQKTMKTDLLSGMAFPFTRSSQPFINFNIAKITVGPSMGMILHGVVMQKTKYKQARKIFSPIRTKLLQLTATKMNLITTVTMSQYQKTLLTPMMKPT